MLSSALAELVLDSKEDKQISGNSAGVKKKLDEIASDIVLQVKRLNWGKGRARTKCN